MSKEKAIEQIKEVKHSLFLVKSMLYIRDEDTLVENMELIIQKCDKALKELVDQYDTKADMEGRNQDFNN